MTLQICVPISVVNGTVPLHCGHGLGATQLTPLRHWLAATHLTPLWALAGCYSFNFFVGMD